MSTSHRSRPMFSTWYVHVHLWVSMASNWSLIPGIAQSKNRQRTARRLVGHGHHEDCNWSTGSCHPWLPFASTISTVDIMLLAIPEPRICSPPHSAGCTQVAINTYITPGRGQNSRGQPLFFHHRSPLSFYQRSLPFATSRRASRKLKATTTVD